MGHRSRGPTSAVTSGRGIGVAVEKAKHGTVVDERTDLSELESEKKRVKDVVHSYLRARLADSEEVVAVESDGPWRHMVRIRGTAKDFVTVWFTVGDRTLHYECYFMPDPDENHEELYRFLLMKNQNMYACKFSLADDHDVFITGQLPLSAVTEEEVDRILGSVYQYSETYFRPALAIGFASHFRAKRSLSGAGHGQNKRNGDTPAALKHSL